MDRRRFVPSTEGLEGRALLSIFGGNGTSNAQRTIENMPDTFVEKTDRVAHLGYYLQQIDPSSPLSGEAVKSVQDALTPIITNLHPASTDLIESFNLTLRDAYPHNSLSAYDSARLNRTFGNVLLSAGATPSQTAALQSSMNLLAKNAANSSQPVVVASNEYAIVLQIGLGIGRPIQMPTSVRLAANNGIEQTNGTSAVTPLANPNFVGTYLPGNTFARGTTIQVVDSHGVVHSSGVTDATVNLAGTYTTKPVTPFAVGTYKLFTRAVDATGHMSVLSVPYILKVVPKREPIQPVAQVLTPPAGPLNIK